MSTNHDHNHDEDNPVLYLAGGNGFPPEVYLPVLDTFIDHYHVMAMLPRPLWEDAPDPQDLTDWEQMAEDLLESLEEEMVDNVIVIGHSMGAIFGLISAVKRPDLISGLALLDPLIFLPEQHEASDPKKQHPLAKQALIRRDRFESIEDAFDYWRSKPLFEEWDDDVLELYVEGILVEDEAGYTLAWSREWEARFFNTQYHQVWSLIEKISPDLPILVIRGETSIPFPRAAAELLQQQPLNLTYVEIEGHGHTFPMSAPDETSARIDEWLHSLDI